MRRGCKHNIANGAGRMLLRAALAALLPLAAAATPADEAADDRVARAVSAYAHALDALEASGEVTGLSTAIVRGREVLLERSMGVTNVESGEAVAPETVFRIASLSKAFASTLAGLLVEDGRLDWDTRVSDVLTWFRMHNNKATNRMTVRDLLSHRTGLPHNTFDRNLERDIPYQELVRRLDRVNMNCPVGECYGYQNIAFSVFGDMVYPLTGDFFTHQVEKRLFQPLGMATATYGPAALQRNTSWARPHVRRNGAFVAVLPKPNYYRVPPAAGVNASIRDLERWLAAQMGAYPDILSPQLLEELHTPLVDTPGQTRYSRWRRARLRHAAYALGWRVLDYSGHTLIYHAGAIEGYRAIIGILPAQGIGMAAVWNCSCSTPGNLMPMFVDRVLGLEPVNWTGLPPAPPREG